MKKTIFTLTICLSFLLITACSDKEKQSTDTSATATPSVTNNSDESLKTTPEEDDVVIEKSFEKTVSKDNTDAYAIQRWYSYYLLDDGTWMLVVNNNGTEETYTYKYRILLHGALNNADETINYVYLSNTPDISFEQAWKASGLSSNSNDYYAFEEAVYVESWLGAMDSHYATDDPNMIYISEE